MSEFISAALPWIMAGIALAILAANAGSDLKKDNKKRNEKKESRMAMGLGFGLLFGVMLNSSGLFENHILGICLGALWGMALATLYNEDDKAKKLKRKE